MRAAQVLIINCKLLLGEAHHVMYCLLTFAPLVVSIAAFFFYWMEFFFYLLEEDLRFDINKIDFEVKWSFQSSKLRLHNSWRWGSRQCAGCKALRGWSFQIQSASLLNPGWIRLEICRDCPNRRSGKIFVSCVNLSRKQNSFLHILQVYTHLNVNFLHNC